MDFGMTFKLSNELLLEVPDPDFIKEFRESLNITQAQAAKLAGITDKALWNKYEKGDRSPSKHSWTLFCLMVGKHPRFKLDNV